MSSKYTLGLRSIREHKQILDTVPKISKQKFEELALTIIVSGNFQHIKVLAGLAGNPYKPFDVVNTVNGKQEVLFRVPAILSNRSEKPFMNEQVLHKLFAIKGDGVQHNAARKKVLDSVIANTSNELNIKDELEKWVPIAKYYKMSLFNGLIDANGIIMDSKEESKVESTNSETMDSFDLDKYL